MSSTGPMLGSPMLFSVANLTVLRRPGHPSTMSRVAHERAAASMAAPGSGASVATPAMPRDTFTSRAPPGCAGGGARGHRAMTQRGIGVTTLGPDTRHQERQARRDGAHHGHLLGSRGADHQAHGAGVACPAVGQTRHSERQGLSRRTGDRIGRDLQALELERARIGRPAQQVYEAVGAVEQRRDGLRPQVRARGHGVRIQRVIERDRVLGSRRADVAALGVRDERQVGWDAVPAAARGHGRRRSPSARRTRR